MPSSARQVPLFGATSRISGETEDHSKADLDSWNRAPIGVGAITTTAGRRLAEVPLPLSQGASFTHGKSEYSGTGVISRWQRVDQSALANEEDYTRLARERESLLVREDESGLTATEQRRIRLIEWTLDRIDNLRFGASIDAWERAVARQEAFADRVEAMVAEVRRARMNAGRPR